MANINIAQIYEIFPTQDDCIAHLERSRWGGTPKCPYCNSIITSAVPPERRHHCNSCNTSFSVTVRTIFHRTRLPLQKWFLVVSLLLSGKKGISARQLGRDIHVDKDTAWRMAMKIREAMAEHKQRKLLRGIVEVVKTYIGGGLEQR